MFLFFLIIRESLVFELDTMISTSKPSILRSGIPIFLIFSNTLPNLFNHGSFEEVYRGLCWKLKPSIHSPFPLFIFFKKTSLLFRFSQLLFWHLIQKHGISDAYFFFFNLLLKLFQWIALWSLFSSIGHYGQTVPWRFNLIFSPVRSRERFSPILL